MYDISAVFLSQILYFCVLGEVVEGGDVEGEFAGFGEFAEADAQGS